MAKKNEKTFEEALEQEGVVETTLGEVLAAVDEATDEKVKFINDNIGLVPTNRRHVFLTWDIEQQYNQMQIWKDTKKHREEWIERNKIENRVKELFIRKKVTLDEVLRVIDFCKEWIKDEQEREIIRIDEEIARLEERRNLINQGA